MRCATIRMRLLPGSIGPGATACRQSRSSSTTRSYCATRTIRASPRSVGRLVCQHRRKWIGGHDLSGPFTPERPLEDLKKLLPSVRVGIYYPDGPDFKLL